jgi:CRISPR system Cascade subunit CasE
MCAFQPGAPADTEDGRVLWRLDPGRDRALTLYISSSERPDLTHLVEQAGWPTGSDPWQTASSEPLLARLQSGQRWAFRLAANPVRSVARPGHERGKRYAHVTVAQQLAWLADRADDWGFSVVDPSLRLTADVTARQKVSFERRTGGDRRGVTISMVTFDGTLQVTNPDALRRTLRFGAGRAKGYGCGLITLAPIP